MSSTQNHRIIKASPEVLYNALTDPQALEQWFAPGNMTGKIHSFDLREGGCYEMSLYYPPEAENQGKTSDKEDRYTARFIELKPYHKIVEAITFAGTDASFDTEMIMEVNLEKVDDSHTKITFLFKNIPAGIRPEDNEEGTRLTLEKLAAYVA